MASRVLSWVNGTDETLMLRVERLAAFFGIPPGHHARLNSVIAESSNTTAGLIIAKDLMDQDGFEDGDYTDTFFKTIPELSQMTMANDDVLFFQTSSGAAEGFNESGGRGLAWDVMKNICFARDTGTDDWTIHFEYDIVPGEMDWSLLYTDLFEHIHQAELLVTGGEPFFQPEQRYHEVGIQ